MGPSGSRHSRGCPWGLGKIAITSFESGVAGEAGPWRNSIGARHLGTLLFTWPHRVGKVRPLGLPNLPLRFKLHLPCLFTFTYLCLDPPTICSGGSAPPSLCTCCFCTWNTFKCSPLDTLLFISCQLGGCQSSALRIYPLPSLSICPWTAFCLMASQQYHHWPFRSSSPALSAGYRPVLHGGQ